MGVGVLPVIGTDGDGWCTLGDRRNIGDAGSARCRSARGSFYLDRTLWIDRTGVLRWGDVVVDVGVARGVTTLGGRGTCAGEGCDWW